MDEDILKVLKSMLSLMQGGSALSSANGTSKLSSGRASQSQKDKDEKTFKALNTNISDANDNFIALNKSMVILNTEVTKAGMGFSALNTSMSKFISTLSPVDAAKLMQASAAATQAAQRGGPTPNQQGAAIAGKLGDGVKQGLTPVVKNLEESGVEAKTVIGKMLTKFGGTATTIAGLEIAALGLFDVAKTLTGQFLALASAGMGSTQNLITLSKNAMLSGLSMKDYTALIGQNIAVVSRSGSLENFQALISGANKQLAEMGIYGGEAAKLQASLADSNTMMGISQDKLGDSINSQISTFDELRKSTNMTADAFANMVHDLSHNEQVQKELIGLAPQERQARQQQLLQIASTGQRLGLAADASKALADALIAQRGETVKGRIDASGQIRQMGQLLGLGDAGERAAQIQMKGQNATPEETEELRKIASQFETATDEAYRTGSLGVQNALDMQREAIGGTGFGKIMAANRPAQLAEDSGAVNQKAFGQHVDKFGQAVGQFVAFAHGFFESVVPSVLTAIGGGLLTVFKGPIIKALQGVFKVAPAAEAGGAAKAIASATEESSALYKALYNVGNAAGKTVKALKDPVGLLQDTAEGIKSGSKALYESTKDAAIATRDGILGLGDTIKGGSKVAIDTLKNSGPIIKGALGDVAAAAKTGASAALDGVEVLSTGFKVFSKAFGPLSGIIDGIIEAITGELAEALNPNGGWLDRIEGIALAALSAIPQMVIDLFSFVFGDELMKPIQHYFDLFRTGFTLVVNGLLLGLVNAVSMVTDFLPKDSGLAKMVNSAKDSLASSVQGNMDALDKLSDGTNTTLKEVSASNTKAADDADKKSKTATDKVMKASEKFNDAQYGMDVTRGGLIQNASEIVGSPGVQVPTPVNPAAVNTADAATAANAAVQAAAANANVGGTDMVTVLNAILSVLQGNLTQTQRTADAAEQLVKGNRPTATFPSGEVVANQLLAPRGMMA